MTTDSRCIGVDWGSSNRRACLLASDGRELGRREDAEGVLSVAPSDYFASLMNLVGDWWRESRGTIWLSGMVGSRNGWQEVPYLPAPVALDDIARQAVALREAQEPRILILPGVSQQLPGEPPDVMRGEETQLLGAWDLGARDGWHVLPGTHSKWVRIEQGRIVRFHTFMTGELFARLREKGALASVASGEADDEAGFIDGLQLAQTAPLAAALFGIRAGVLLDTYPQAQAASRLSGILIGAEWKAAEQLGGFSEGRVTLIGADGLTHWYALAAAQHGIGTQTLSAETCHSRATLRCLRGAQ